jgi:serine/threonine-protein kinase
MNPQGSEESEHNVETRRGSTSVRVVPSADPPTIVSSNSSTPTHVSDSKPRNRPEPHDAQPTLDAMPKVGTRIGAYELGPPIGIGGMATVYAAQDLSLERTVALKILPPISAQDSEVLQRFLLEGKAAARLDHPNIARIYALGHDGSYYFLAFEYVEGRTVRQWIEDQKRIDVDQALDWSIQTATALAHADRRGVVHRDIKPSNLIVTPSGQVKLVDLGLARRYEMQGQVDLTQSGVTLGTFDYISPEQARDPRNVDIRSDLYSLGCTMFHMLTGAPPFPGQNVVQKLLQHQERQAPDIRASNAEVPDSLALLVAQLMSKSPADRPTSAEACVKQLQSIRDERALLAAAELDVDSTSMRGLLMWLVPALVLTAAITIGSWLTRDKTPVAFDTQPGSVVPNAGADQAGVSTATDPVAKAIVPKPLTSESGELRKPPTTFRVKDGQTLAQALKESSPGSVVLLTESNRYEIRASEMPVLEKTDLTIRGEADVRPTIVSAIPDPEALAVGETYPGLLRFRDSRITVQNVEFDLGSATGEWIDSGIVAENCDLTVRDVLFIGDTATDKTGGGFLRVGKAPGREDASWRPLRVENCRFLGNRPAIAGRGPLDISVFDSAVLGSEAIVDVTEAERETPWPCLIRLDHVNFKATAQTPVLQLGHSAAGVRVRNCVFAPKPGVQISLVNSRRPSRVDWFGRENLYGDIETFMESPRIEEEIVDFDSWSRSTSTVREQASLATGQFVYGPVESVALALAGRWSDAFAMNRGPWTGISVGVRAWSDIQDPNRPRPPTVVDAAESKSEVGRNSSSPSNMVKSVAALPNGSDTNRVEPPLERSVDIDEAPVAMNDPAPMPMPMQSNDQNDSGRRPTEGPRPERVVGPIADNGNRNVQRPETATVPIRPEVAAVGNDASANARTPTDGRSRFGDDPQPQNAIATDVRTAEEFRRAVAGPFPPQGVSLTIRAGAVLRFDDLITLSDGRLNVTAGDGEPRPKIVFGSQKRALVENRARWTINKGASLRLRGIDIEWDANEPTLDRLFDVATGTQVVLEECNLTSLSARADLVFFAAIDSGPNEFAENSNLRAAVRLIDCFVRTAGGVFRTPGALKGELELSGTLAVSGRPLIAIGSPGLLQTAQTTRLQLNQSTLVLGASLATVNLGPALAEQPHLECEVRRSVLAGNPAAEGPLFEVLGGDPDEEISDCISWEGDEVAYHEWSTYRMDRNNLSGMLARRQNREEWQLSQTQHDNRAIHGEIEFPGGNFWSSDRKPWDALPSDFVIDADSPAHGLGARVDRLPRTENVRKTAPAFDPDFFEP